MFGQVSLPKDHFQGTSASYIALSWEEVSRKAVISLYQEDKLYEEAPSRTYLSGEDRP